MAGRIGSIGQRVGRDRWARREYLYGAPSLDAISAEPGLQPVYGPAPFRTLSEISTFLVPLGSRRERADKVLARAFPIHSRVAFQRALEAGLVKVGDRVLGQADEVKAGETIEFSLPEVTPTELKAVDIPLDVIFEDKHLIVLNKPSGMVVHPGVGTGEDTLVHALLAHCAGQLSGIGGVERPGIVHRIDKETTGLIVVAKTDEAHRALSDQFAVRSLVKEYVALVAGLPRAASGTVDSAIARHPVHRHRMTTGEGGRPSKTDWTVLEVFPERAALVRCRIHTGRTHQIRVHMKSIGHPLLGDATYGWKQAPKQPKPGRVMLHAEHLIFRHPVTDKPMDLTAPLPADFKKMLKALGKK